MKILLYTDLFVYNSFDTRLFFFHRSASGQNSLVIRLQGNCPNLD
jgi:hypothetical protein